MFSSARLVALSSAVLLAGCGHAPVSGAVPAPHGMLAARAAGAFESHTYQDRTYKLYVPAAYHAGAAMPLVVMLHGCTQDPDQFAAGTRMNALADEKGFLVMYPEQPSSAQQMKCWNWFTPADQVRGSGEPALIAGMVDQVEGQYTVDAGAVFVGGLSAGAAMSVIMGATYPDVFAAIGVGSGLEYEAATTQMAGQMAMIQGGPDPARQGEAAYQAMGAAARVVPAIVFHGNADHTVAPVNGKQIAAQWARTDDLAGHGIGLDDRPDASQAAQAPGGDHYTVYDFKDAAGETVIEEVLVDGMGHAWSGGSSAGSYTDPKGPDASALMWTFFDQHRRTPARGRRR